MANSVLYGFIGLKDLFDRRLNEVGTDVINRAITASVAEHNRQMGAFMRLFAQPTTAFKMRYKTPTVARLQPLDANGRARPIKPAGHYDVAFPLQMAGGAWGQNYLSRVKMTVEEANEATATLVSADFRWVRDHVLAALFANANWSYDDKDDEAGALTVKGLANGDTDIYLIQEGADTGATDTHYLAQAAAIDNSNNPFPTIYDELSEHPENTGEVITMVPTNLVTSVGALTNFHEAADPNIRVGSATDVLVGSLGIQVPGKVIGYVDKNWIVEWKALPDNYMISVTTGGEPPLGMRQHPEAELQGFNRVAQRDDHPFYESQWLRIAGFGAWNRVGAVVYRIGNGSYAVPTGYGVPMA